MWPKSIRGSTPKIKGTCQIEKAANESAHFMRFYVPCPHCGEAQYLKFGDESTPFGLKWEKDSPESVFYLCEHHGCVSISLNWTRATGGGFVKTRACGPVTV